MKTLLVYALNPESGLIKKQFTDISVKKSSPGMELLSANANFDLLRTGIGLERAEAAMNTIPDPQIYERVIHFGVSGSLDEDLPVGAFIMGQNFTALDRQTIRSNTSDHNGFKPVTFFSSQIVVVDENSREVASAGGAQAVDMESYAIADYCKKNDLPLQALRIISDRAGSSTPDEFRKNFKSASRELQSFLIDHIL